MLFLALDHHIHLRSATVPSKITQDHMHTNFRLPEEAVDKGVWSFLVSQNFKVPRELELH